MNDTDTERLLTATLTDHATDAPNDHLLLTRVQARLIRRRGNTRRIGAILVTCAAVSTAIIATHSALDRPTEQPPVAQPPPAPAPGWAWESYQTVQVQVPLAWTQKQLSGPAPCLTIGGSKPNPAPVVGRLNPWLHRDTSYCKTGVLPLAERREYLWFNDVQQPGVKSYDAGWTEETRVVAGVKLSVLTKEPHLRRRVLDSARPITGADHHGCTPAEPLAQPGARPPGRTSIDEIGTTSSIEICQYWYGTLITGTKLTGQTADRVTGLLRTSATGTPDLPPDCAQSAPERDITGADQTYVLRFTGSTGSATGVLRLSRCRFDESFDDGRTQRTTDRTILPTIVNGPLFPSQPLDMFDTAGKVTPPAR